MAATVEPEKAPTLKIDRRILRWFLTYLRPQRPLVVATLFLLALVSGAQLLQPVVLKWAIDDAIASKNLAALVLPSVVFAILLVFEFACRFFQLYTLERTGQNIVLSMRSDVFSHLQALDASYFDRHPIGRLMTRVTSDIEALNEAFTSGLVLILADFAKLAVIVVLLLAYDPWLALVTFAILPPMILLTNYFRSRIRLAYRSVRKLVARLGAFLQESITGIRVIKIFVREKRDAREFEALNKEHLGEELRVVRFESLFSAVAELLGTLTLAAILFAGSERVLSASLSFGTLVLFIKYAGMFFQPIQELSQRFAVMQAAVASSERVFELLETRPLITSPKAPKPLPACEGGSDIAFENVSFSYEPGVPVLRNVSFRIPSGQNVAVVGPTGSGKTTLVRLLTRLYEIDEGRITLGGRDIRDYDLKELRRSIGVVLQDPFLFAGSIGRNIALGDASLDKEAIRAAAKAVRADRFIEALPLSYDEPVSERGSNLSSGEKQLIAFARALSHAPPVLVLDEATASVDPATEADIQDAMRRMLRSRTSLVIAHRLSTIEGADRVLVLRHGALVEDGDPQELMNKDDGLFRELYSIQRKHAEGNF